MRLTTWNGCPWLLRHLVIAIAYGFTYFALVSVSESYWWPSAGLRLACLLLVPYRYWPALLVGEFVPLAYQSVLCVDQFGFAYAALHSFPAIALAMPAAKWFRDRHKVTQASFAASISTLLAVAAVISLMIAVVNSATFLLMHLPAGYKSPNFLAMNGRRFLGNFLGILMVVPVALAVREAVNAHASLLGIRRILPRYAIWEALGFAVVFCGLVALGRWTDDFTVRYATDAAFFVPVTWLAFRRGWQGAAFGSVVANIGIMLTPHDTYDPGTILALSVLAFTVTVMLLLGAKTTLLQLALRDSREHLLLARQELYLNEVKRRSSAHMLDRLQTSMRAAHTRVINRLRFFLPPGEEISYRNQLEGTLDTLDRLRETLSPREWQRLGHPAALQGTIGLVLKDLGVTYDADLRGALSRLSPDLAVALYRLICEALAFLLTRHPTDSIRLKTSLRMLADGKIEVAAVVTSDGAIIAPAPQDKLQSGLGVGGLSDADMQSRAKLYSGSVLIDALPTGAARITLKLRDETGTTEPLEAP